RDPEEVLRPLGRRRSRPLAVEGLARGVDRDADVLRPGLRHLGERLLARRTDRREPLARARLDEVAADEEPVALLDRDDVARLRRGRVVPPGGDRCPILLALE